MYVNTLREKWVTVTANVYQQLAVKSVFVQKRYCDGLSHDKTLSANQRSLNVRYISCNHALVS